MLQTNETFLPSTDNFRDLNPDAEWYHGENSYEPPSTTAAQQARRRVAVLDDKPNVAIILTTYPHDCLLQLQHRFQQGFYVSDNSVLAMREDFQSIQLFKKLD